MVYVAMFDPTSMPKLDRIMSSFKENPPNPAPAPRLLTHISPNNFEVKELYACIEKLGLTETDSWFSFINSLRLGANWRNGIERLAGGNRGELEWLVHQGVAQMMVSLLPWVDNVWLKVGEQGLIHLGIVDASVSSKLPEGARMIEHELPEGEFSGKGMDRPVLRLSHYPPPQKLENMVSSTGAGDSLVGGLVAGLISRAPGHQIAQIGLRAARASLMSARAVGDVKRLE
jgi:pseudouridine-5'-phosphate glycosidase/pseudouridine kinase